MKVRGGATDNDGEVTLALSLKSNLGEIEVSTYTTIRNQFNSNDLVAMIFGDDGKTPLAGIDLEFTFSGAGVNDLFYNTADIQQSNPVGVATVKLTTDDDGVVRLGVHSTYCMKLSSEVLTILITTLPKQTPPVTKQVSCMTKKAFV